MEIIWKRMIYHGEDLGDLYLVSNTGEIKGVKSGKIRKKNIGQRGYYFVGISLGSRNKKPCIKIHRAVAETFLPNPNNLPAINHIDGNKLNNTVNNLEWCSYQENTKHAVNNKIHTNKPKKVMCINTGVIFESVKAAGRWCGISRGNHAIDDCARGRTQYGGTHPVTGEKLSWKFLEETS